jgi:hypothetical protein
MIEVTVGKQVVINKQGSADVTYDVHFRNKSDKAKTLKPLKQTIEVKDAVNIKISDSKGKSIPHEKWTEADFVCIGIKSLEKTKLEPEETYTLTWELTIPSMAKRFDNTYFFSDTEVWRYGVAETTEWTVTHELPRLFSKYSFWKEMHVNAQQASRIYTQDGVKKVEYQFVLSKGRHREIVFMFQERYNSRVVALASFLLGIVLTQLAGWIVNLLKSL